MKNAWAAFGNAMIHVTIVWSNAWRKIAKDFVRVTAVPLPLATKMLFPSCYRSPRNLFAFAKGLDDPKQAEARKAITKTLPPEPKKS